MYITKLRYRWILIVLTVIYIHALTQVIEAAVPSDGPLWLSNPYWKAGIMGDYEYPGFDAAGYSDKLYWGLSPRHAVTGYHEMLSGEWAAAIYYDGLAEAMWLTDYFRFPYWTTNSNFFIWDAPSQWDNPNNPVVGYDTGHSSIRNGQVEIDLDYEIVDLGVQGQNGEGGSPMAFGTFQGRPAYVRSERYVLLQTYTIANITANPLTNLEFYQMLHGHPGDEYSPVVYSVYETADYGDPMATYVPRNPVHSVGNFRYDITQWNDTGHPDATATHQDWIGFSSTIAPDVFENGFYIGGHDNTPNNKPPWPGTHWDIEDRTINNEALRFGEVAGAMGWHLGILQPGVSVKRTVAIMFGAGPIQRSACGLPIPIAHWDFDESPGSTIAWDSIGNNHGTLTNMDPSTDWVTSGISRALDFDGINDYVSLSHPVGALTGDSVTISAWIKPAAGLSADVYYPIVTQLHYNVSNQEEAGYFLSLHGYWPDFFLNQNCYVTSSSAIGYNNWYWVVGTYDGETIKIFINGQESNRVTSSGHSGISSNAYIGFNGYTGDPRYFRGQINDVWVFACPWGPATDCYPTCDPNYLDWIAMGKPSCWCYSLSDKTRYQCDGDVDGAVEGLQKYRVYSKDLKAVVDNWKKKITDTGWNYCADIDHKEDTDTVLHYRVYSNDLATINKNWKKKDSQLPGNCPRCGGQAAAKGQAAALDIDALAKWLDAVWLEPDVRKVLDEKTWQKFVESVMADIESESLKSAQ